MGEQWEGPFAELKGWVTGRMDEMSANLINVANKVTLVDQKVDSVITNLATFNTNVKDSIAFQSEWLKERANEDAEKRASEKMDGITERRRKTINFWVGIVVAVLVIAGTVWAATGHIQINR